jgi:hypothetical protein
MLLFSHTKVFFTDDILQAALVNRQHYCKSVMLAANNADKGLYRLSNGSPAKLFAKALYAIQGPIHSSQGLIKSYCFSSYNTAFMVTAAYFAILLVAAHRLREERNIQASTTTVEEL